MLKLEKFVARTVPIRGPAPEGQEVDIMVEADDIPVVEGMLGRQLDWSDADPFNHADALGVGSLAFILK